MRCGQGGGHAADASCSARVKPPPAATHPAPTSERGSRLKAWKPKWRPRRCTTCTQHASGQAKHVARGAGTVFGTTETTAERMHRPSRNPAGGGRAAHRVDGRLPPRFIAGDLQGGGGGGGRGGPAPACGVGGRDGAGADRRRRQLGAELRRGCLIARSSPVLTPNSGNLDGLPAVLPGDACGGAALGAPFDAGAAIGGTRVPCIEPRMGQLTGGLAKISDRRKLAGAGWALRLPRGLATNPLWEMQVALSSAASKAVRTRLAQASARSSHQILSLSPPGTLPIALITAQIDQDIVLNLLPRPWQLANPNRQPGAMRLPAPAPFSGLVPAVVRLSFRAAQLPLAGARRQASTHPRLRVASGSGGGNSSEGEHRGLM